MLQIISIPQVAKSESIESFRSRCCFSYPIEISDLEGLRLALNSLGFSQAEVRITILNGIAINLSLLHEDGSISQSSNINEIHLPSLNGLLKNLTEQNKCSFNNNENLIDDFDTNKFFIELERSWERYNA